MRPAFMATLLALAGQPLFAETIPYTFIFEPNSISQVPFFSFTEQLPGIITAPGSFSIGPTAAPFGATLTQAQTCILPGGSPGSYLFQFGTANVIFHSDCHVTFPNPPGPEIALEAEWGFSNGFPSSNGGFGTDFMEVSATPFVSGFGHGILYIGPVPEPASWSMLYLGLAIGLLLRHKKIPRAS
jgi:hypothetical protein